MENKNIRYIEFAIWLLAINLFFACKANTNTNTISSGNINIVDVDSSREIVKAKVPQIVLSSMIDTAINEISLNHAESTIKKLGNNAWDYYIEDKDEEFPYIECTNKSKNQLLRLFFHYGGVKNSVDEIEISMVTKKTTFSSKIIIVDTDTFLSNKGLFLGMKKADVFKIYNRDSFNINKVVLNQEELTFNLTDNDAYVKTKNQYAYFSTLVFRNDRLIRYRFGFEYP